MASWDELTSAIHRAYETTDLGPRALRLDFATVGDRSQAVFVSFADESDDLPWAQIDAPIAPLHEVDIRPALALVEEAVCGGLCQLSLGGVPHLTIRHCVSLPDLDWPDFDRPLRLLALAADAIAVRLGAP